MQIWRCRGCPHIYGRNNSHFYMQKDVHYKFGRSTFYAVCGGTRYIGRAGESVFTRSKSTSEDTRLGKLWYVRMARRVTEQPRVRETFQHFEDFFFFLFCVYVRVSAKRHLTNVSRRDSLFYT